MNRIALSKRLEGLSQVFASDHPIGRDLKTMSYVLANMADEKYAAVLSEAFEADAAEDKEAGMMPEEVRSDPAREKQLEQMVQKSQAKNPNKAVMQVITTKSLSDKVKDFILKADPKAQLIGKEQPQAKEAGEEEMDTSKETPKTAGEFWSREASEAVMQNLVRDVVGMDKSICCDTNQKLTPEQRPEGQHNGEKPASLKPDQTPDQKDVLKSNIVEKAKAAKPINKEAAKKEEIVEEVEEKESGEAAVVKDELVQEGKEAGGCKGCENPECECNKGKEAQDEGEPPVEEKEEEKKEEEEDKEASVLMSEGVELVSPMEDVSMDEKEAANLSKLFE